MSEEPVPVDRTRKQPAHLSTGAGNATGEPVFWRRVGVQWRHLAGGLTEVGFSFEWHETGPTDGFEWSKSFHPNSVEVCLNLEGHGWVGLDGQMAEFGPETAGFFGSTGRSLAAQRRGGEHHRFLSVEFSVGFLQQHLGSQLKDLHPVVRACLEDPAQAAGISAVNPITHRQRDLLASLLHPPVLRSAQRLWHQSKALEFAAEFFFAGDDEPLCTRAKRLAQERVAKTKAVLMANLEESLSLEELGRQVGCSPFYLSRTFTQETGLTISQWLRRVRLERAAELLRTRTCNVTEAALRVGYSSLSHFSQAFREVFGCCPGLYPIQTPAQRPPDRSGRE